MRERKRIWMDILKGGGKRAEGRSVSKEEAK